jgi:hypothetical protein
MAKDYPNSGLLYRDQNKKEARDRDFRGSADITCPHCGNRFEAWLSGWIKGGIRGKFLSLRFKPQNN